jgi:membrane protease YdiL (CAAX protease family)
VAEDRLRGSGRLSGSDKRALLLWVLLGIVGVLFAYKYFFQAFPEASVDFKVSRGEALARAQKFLSSVGEDVSGYRTSIVFDLDDNAKTYLERGLGLKQANQLMSKELNIWYWDVRFFKPQQEEEFLVRVNPAGEIVGYDHKVGEARAGAALERTAAEASAKEFLSGKMGVDLSGWDFLTEEANSSKKPNRLDWSFSWEKHGFRAKDAPYRLRVTLQGDRPGSSEEFLQVPEAWERSFAHLRSSNDSLTLVFTVFYIALLVAAIWLAIQLTYKGMTSWRGALVLGAMVAGLLFLQSLNDWPLWSASYNTTESYGTFLAMQIARALALAVVTAITITLVLPAGEPLYRASQPDRLQLSKIFTLRGLRSKEFFSSAVVGLSLAAVHIGYVVAFYIVASHYGAWAPQEVNYQDSVNTAFPWISGAAIGLLASTNEEFTFRLFAIPFFARLTKSRWIAVIVPAFMWSFLHSNYPQEPPYIRGIEIGLFGIVAGLVMLRWGILATLIWHYTVDASLVGLFLLRSNSLYFKVSGVVVAAAAVAPLAFAGVAYLVRGRFEADEDLLNRAAPAAEFRVADAPVEIATAGVSRRYAPLTPPMIGVLAVCLVAGGVLAWRGKTETLGDFLKLSVNAKSVRLAADEILRKRGVNPDSYKRAILLVNVTDPVTNEFLRERVGVKRLNEIYAAEMPGVVWQVRYFRDSQPEEYSVKLGQDGALLAFNHRLPEDAAGASLSKEEALDKAQAYLTDVKKIDLRQWNLVEQDSDKRIHRTDHELAWEMKKPLDEGYGSAANGEGHAFVRFKVAVLGDEVVDYRGSYYSKPDSREEQEATEGGTLWRYIKIPDEWRRKQEEQTLPRTLLSYGLYIVFLVGGGLTALIIFLKNLRSETARSVPWKRLSGWAIWGMVAYLIVFAFGDRIQTALNSYNTAIPYKTTMGILGIGVLLGAPVNFGLVIFVFGLAWYYGKLAFGEQELPVGGRLPGIYYRDALWIGVCGTAGLVGVGRLIALLSKYWPTVERNFPASIGQNFDSSIPSAAAFGQALSSGLLRAGLVAAVAAFVAAMVKPRWLRFLIFLLAALSLVGGDWSNAAGFAKQFVGQAIVLGVIVFAVQKIVRFNVLGYFLVSACTSLLGAATELLGQPDAYYRTNGYVLLLMMGLLLAGPLILWRMRGSGGGSEQIASPTI